MKTTVVLNPRAGSARRNDSALCEQAQRFGWRVVESQSAEDATRLAREAVRRGADRVVAAGGDGTVSHVVQGLMAEEPRAVLGVIPMGTGNDFARTLHMPTNVSRACQWLADTPGQSGRADLLEVVSEQERAWAFNTLNGGIATQIRHSMDDVQKQRWGPLAFVLGGLEVAGSDVPTWDVEIRLDDGPTRHLEDIVSLTVANARTAGGGYAIAPSADIEDGQFDLVVISGEKLTALVEVAVRAKLGLTFGSEHVEHTLGRRLEVRCPEGFSFSVDGEPFSGRRVHVSVHRAALPFVAGPEYATAPPGPVHAAGDALPAKRDS